MIVKLALPVWIAIDLFSSCVAAYCALDGADGSAMIIVLFLVWSTVSLWPVLSRSGVRRPVAAGTR